MADGRPRRRNVHPHEIANLNYGHFGTPSYNKSTQTWHFQRHIESSGAQHSDEDETNHSGVFPLRLLHHRNSASDKKLVQSSAFLGRSGPYASRRVLKWFPELIPAAGIPRGLANQDLDYQLYQDAPITRNQLLFARAPYTYTRSHHVILSRVPFVAAVANGDCAALTLHPIQVQNANVIDEDGIAAPRDIPLLSKGTHWIAPLNEPILQLHYSSADSMVAYRQSSASTLCLPSVDDRPLATSEPQRLIFNPVLTLPNSRTGNHPHSDIAFSSPEGLNFGVVDTHGNWSVWRISGKRSLSTRLLYQARLLISGKLWSWTEERRPPKDDNPFFDGWHKICFLKADDNTKALLVANRQHARMYDTDAAELEIVPLHLQSTSDWVLDICVSKADASMCFVLTSSKVLMLHMRSDNEPGALLRLVCMSSHFLGGGELILKMSVLEVPAAIYAFIHTAIGPQLTLLTFCRGTEPASWSVSDPIPWRLCSEIGLPSELVSEVVFLPLESSSRNLNDAALPFLVKGVARTRSGQLTEMLYENIGDKQSEDGSRNLLITAWPASEKRPNLSSQIVDDEDEDLDDYIVKDHVRDFLAPSNSRLEASHSAYKAAHDWSWIFDSTDDSGSARIISASLEEAEASIVGEDNPLATMRLLREIVKEFRIDDVDEAERSIDAWATHMPSPNLPGESIEMRRVANAAPTGLPNLYTQTIDKFVESLSDRVAPRVRHNTERMSRQVAVDLALSSIGLLRAMQRSTQLVDEDTQPIDEGQQQSSDVNSAFSRLGKYTTFTIPHDVPRPEAVSDLLAHLRDAIEADPDQYSYADVELELAHKRLQAQDLDPVAKRRAERVEAARRKRAEKARATGKAAISQETPAAVPSSSQDAEQRGMTQPERGDYGTRPAKNIRAGKKKQKTAGF